MSAETLRDIRHHLARHGTTFEGRELPLSLTPTVLLKDDVDRVARDGTLILRVLERAIQRFLAEHKRGDLNGPLHRFFNPYERWWDLIASERRTSAQIGLMRYDAVREDSGAWRFLETNTACPGGTISCARIRDAWLATPFGQSMVRGKRLAEFPIDRPEGFVRYLAKRAETMARGAPPNIALCSYQGSYTNELDALQSVHAGLVERGELAGGQIVVCDLRDLVAVEGRICARGIPVVLIHNKIDQLMIDPDEPALAGWRAAAVAPGVEFLNGLGALYLTEAKRILALLTDPVWAAVLGMSAAESAAVLRRVPETRLLTPPLLRVLEFTRDHLVLKADALTRGAGVYLGSRLTQDEWVKALTEVASRHGVYQAAAATPQRGDEYFGVDLFYFEGRFAGAVSRCHTNPIFNVGNGGKEAPTLIVHGSPR